MRAFVQLSFAVAALCAVSGCGIIRGIEQWKCDNWGMCHFGIQPSVPASGGCGPNAATYPPAMLLPPPAAPHLPAPSQLDPYQQQPYLPDPSQGF